MSDDHRPPGRTTVSPGVLTAIARMAALGVPGVKAVGTAAASGALFRRREAEGVRMLIQDGIVTGDIFLVIKGGFNIREVGREVQSQVARAIQEMVGTPVARVDIHVENVDYEGGEA